MVDSRTLARYLEGDDYEPNRRYRQILCQPPFERFSGETSDEHREQVWQWCQWLAEQGHGELGLPAALGGDAKKFYHLAVALAHFDTSLMTKACVQFGLFMQALGRLGSERHHKWLHEASTLELAGCFAMTETDHGSNVQRLETEALYDPHTNEFIIHTPHPGARKDYIGGAALHARMAVVFAQLEVPSGAKGVHAFLVPIRFPNGETFPGVSIEDCGRKGGLNGVDNGRITFNQVRVPREYLLDRQAQVHSDGTYDCGDMSESRRFFTMIGALVAGRIMVTAASAAGARTCLTIAIRYAGTRRQFGPRDKREVPILSYQAHQRRLLPSLAALLAIDAGLSQVVHRYDKYLKDDVEDRELDTFASSLKAYASSLAIEWAQTCRECCGGAGYLTENRLTEIRNDLDIFTTFEGDNTILNLLVARNLLTDFRRDLSGPKIVKALSWAGKGFSLAAQSNPLKARQGTAAQVTTTDFLSSAFRFRLARLRYTLAGRIRKRISAGEDIFDVMNGCQDHSLSLAKAYCEEKIYRCFRNQVESCPPGWDQNVLSKLFQLFSVSRLEADRGWFLEQGYINSTQSLALRNQTLILCDELSGDANAVIDAFELPDRLVGASILS